MARKDYYYVPLRNEMVDSLDYIIKKEGKKYGWDDKMQLIRCVLSEFIANYEEYNNIIIARNSVRLDKKRDGMKPMNWPMPT